MTYVFSAGLRVLLMMYKFMEDKSCFWMMGVREEVRKILTTTRFDQFFCKGNPACQDWHNHSL